MDYQMRCHEDEAVPPFAADPNLLQNDLVRVEDVTKSFGSKTALKGVSFSVPLAKSAVCSALTALAKQRFSVF
jgi:hypothetical protein